MKVIGDNCVRGVFGKASIPWGSPSLVKIGGTGDDSFKLPDEGVFVSSYDLEKGEKRGIIQCFKNVNHVYAFGQDPESSRYSVTLSVFMQAPECATEFKSGKALASIIDEYKRLRVSEHPYVVSVSVDDGAIVNGILTGVRVSVLDASLNLLAVVLSFSDLDVE